VTCINHEVLCYAAIIIIIIIIINQSQSQVTQACLFWSQYPCHPVFWEGVWLVFLLSGTSECFGSLWCPIWCMCWSQLFVSIFKFFFQGIHSELFYNCGITDCPAISSLLDTNIFLSSFLLNTCKLHSSLKVWDHVSQPYKITNKVTAL